MLEGLKAKTKRIIIATVSKSREDVLKYVEQKKQTQLRWHDRFFGKKIDFNTVSIKGDRIEINPQPPTGRITIGFIGSEASHCQLKCEINPVNRLLLFQLFFGVFFLLFFTVAALRITTDSQIIPWVLFTWAIVLLTLWFVYWYNKQRAISYVKKFLSELDSTNAS